MRLIEIVSELEKCSSSKNVEGMGRFGIRGTKAYGCGVPAVRKIAARVKNEEKNPEKRNALAAELWKHGFHEEKLLASMVATPSIGWKTAEKWISDCNNWAEIDQLCMNLLGGMEGAEEKALEFSKSDKEWRKRAGFALMAVVVWKQKGKFPKEYSDKFLSAIERESTDGRNFVRKAVNWALRHIGKMTDKKRWKGAVALSRKLSKSSDKAARWIGTDALRELEKKGPRNG